METESMQAKGIDEVSGDLKREQAVWTPLLIDINWLSRLLQRSVASLHRDDAKGRLPTALRIGGSKRWRYAEIVAWVEAGMPDRDSWTARLVAGSSAAASSA
jgi:predicted DNA-binding transcriptional regulator AlpA